MYTTAEPEQANTRRERPMPARAKAAKKMPVRKSPAKKAAAKQKRPAPRLPVLDEDKLTAEQRALLDSIRSGPRGASVPIRGPFAVFLHAPAYGQLAQTLGGYLRYQTGVPPRLSEFAILCTARLWRAQYEWFAHATLAERAGVKPATIRDLHAGRPPKSAPKDERAIYDFIHELYKTRRVSDKTYKRVQAVLGDAVTVELVGILGYYVMVAMILNVYRMMPPEDSALPFSEK
jgi:4-carboxymuconolactone decarboxylase